MASDDQPLIWAIRFTQRTERDIKAAWDYFDECAGEAVADAWDKGLKSEIAKLAQFPTI